jgi:GNAT superfamily N-acetyltransferase
LTAPERAIQPGRVTVRLAGPRDLSFLPSVERRASIRFADSGMRSLAEGPTLPAELLARQQALGLVWVAGDPPVGFALALAFTAGLHLHEVSVIPAAGGRGLGSALVEEVSAEAARRGLREVTIVTFRDIPWNGPWYRRLGFRPSTAAARRPEIAALLEEERRTGLAALGPRVVMRRAAGALRPKIATSSD